MKRSPVTNPLTARLAALTETLRLRICHVLEGEELTVGELCRVFQLPQSTVSRHLKVLSDAGWLARRAEGTATLYGLPVENLDADARDLWNAVRKQFEPISQLEEDRRRTEAVLSERRTDSITYFGRVAGEWNQVRTDLFGRHFANRALLGFLPSKWTVADLGCGVGCNAEVIASHVREVICVDQSEPMLDAARERLAGVSNVRFVQGPLEALPLEDACVDAAMCLLVLHHVADPIEGLSEMARIVRPGGSALVVDMFEHDRVAYRNTMGHMHLGFAPQRMATMLEECGFDQVRTTPLPIDPEANGPGLFAATGKRVANSE